MYLLIYLEAIKTTRHEPSHPCDSSLMWRLSENQRWNNGLFASHTIVANNRLQFVWGVHSYIYVWRNRSVEASNNGRFGRIGRWYFRVNDSKSWHLPSVCPRPGSVCSSVVWVMSLSVTLNLLRLSVGALALYPTVHREELTKNYFQGYSRRIKIYQVNDKYDTFDYSLCPNVWCTTSQPFG